MKLTELAAGKGTPVDYQKLGVSDYVRHADQSAATAVPPPGGSLSAAGPVGLVSGDRSGTGATFPVVLLDSDNTLSTGFAPRDLLSRKRKPGDLRSPSAAGGSHGAGRACPGNVRAGSSSSSSRIYRLRPAARDRGMHARRSSTCSSITSRATWPERRRAEAAVDRPALEEHGGGRRAARRLREP